MDELVKVSLDDLKSLELLMEFRGENFREKYLYRCVQSHYNEPKAEYLKSLSDIEAIMYIVDKESNMQFSSEEYLLLHDDVPVCSCVLRYVNPITCDIEIKTLESERLKGYAKKTIKLVEEHLFKETDVVFTTIKDITTTGASTKLAISLGYKLANTGYYIKINPYITLEEAKRRAEPHRKAM